MKLELDAQEAVLLGDILAEWLGQVRSEIRQTDQVLGREEMKHEEDVVEHLLVRLPQGRALSGRR